MKETPALVIDHVSKRFSDRVVVDEVSLEAHAGKVYCLIGPNGAGKTTLIKLMTGQYSIDSGTISIFGHDLVTHPLEAKAHLGYIPDEPWVYPYLTGREFLTFSAGLYELSKPEEKIAKVSKHFYLAEPLDAPMQTYSRGTKQKIMFMAALLHTPKVLVIDEPIVGLDVFSQEAFSKLISDFANKGGSVFMATHSLHIAEAVGDTFGIMDKGNLVASGPLKDLVKEAKLKSGGLSEVFKKLTEW